MMINDDQWLSMMINDDVQVVDAVQAALKTEMREIKKIQQALRQLADEVFKWKLRFLVIIVRMLVLMARIEMMSFRLKGSSTRMRELQISWSKTWGRKGQLCWRGDHHLPLHRTGFPLLDCRPWVSKENWLVSTNKSFLRRDALDIDQTAFTLENSSHEIQVFLVIEQVEDLVS